MCTREERREELMDEIIPLYSEISGMYQGVDGGTYVALEYRQDFFKALCRHLKLYIPFDYGVSTIYDYTTTFVEAMERSNEIKAMVTAEIEYVIEKFCGESCGLNEVIGAQYLPTVKDDPVWAKRKEIDHALRLGRIKNALRSRFGYWKDSLIFYNAQTPKELRDVLFPFRYRAVCNQ